MLILACTRAPALAASIDAPDFQPSFDCARASSEVEQLICHDEALAMFDVALDHTLPGRAGRGPARDSERARPPISARHRPRAPYSMGDTRGPMLSTLAFLLACTRTPAPAPIVTWDNNIEPSFDCARARSDVEHLICDEEVLAKLDVALDRTYRDAPPEGLRKLQGQRDWLAARDACSIVPDARECVRLTYTSRLRELCALSNRWCGVFADGSLDFDNPSFDGMDVVSIIPSDDYESLFIAGAAVVGQSSCGIAMAAREVDGELLATTIDEDFPLCMAKVLRTRDGIRIETSDSCQNIWCGAAATWGGTYRRLTDPAEQRRWEKYAGE